MLPWQWPARQLDAALVALTGKLPGAAATARTPTPDETLEAGEARTEEIERYADAAGLDLEAVSYSFADIDAFLSSAAPAVVLLNEQNEFAVILGVRGRRVRVLTPELEVCSISRADIERPLRDKALAEHEEEVTATLTALSDVAGLKSAARRRFEDELLAGERTFGGWIVRPSAETGFSAQFSLLGGFSKLAGIGIAYLLQYVAWIASWWVIGKSLLGGRVDTGTLLLWCLLLFSVVAIRGYVVFAQSRIATLASIVVKKQLLSGILRADPGRLRTEGPGRHFARVMESESLEALALGGLFLCLTSIIELLVASWILPLGIAGVWHLLLFFLVMLALLGLAYVYYRAALSRNLKTMRLTNELVEKMEGHFTRQVQLAKERWHTEEDSALADYKLRCDRLNRFAVLLDAAPRVWVLIGIAGLLPSVMAGTERPELLVVSIGAILLIAQSIATFVAGLTSLVDARLAWSEVAELLIRRSDERSAPSLPAPVDTSANAADRNTGAYLDVRNVSYRVPGRDRNLLSNVSLSIGRGDRLQIRGPSGAGKSTLASIIAGMRPANSGVVSIAGLDLYSLGHWNWTRRVVAVPQFHENYVFRGSFAFNLLMGKRWPASDADLYRAVAVCEGLGLSGLLSRMPNGIWEEVGESGWQLSHGERSRLFVARALLQKPEVLILDESLGSLDPVAARQTVEFVSGQVSTLLIIAHP